jgi:hypothetical protein
MYLTTREILGFSICHLSAFPVILSNSDEELGIEITSGTTKQLTDIFS